MYALVCALCIMYNNDLYDSICFIIIYSTLVGSIWPPSIEFTRVEVSSSAQPSSATMSKLATQNS